MLTAHLNQKLEALLPKDARFAIAFSGGGDSTALIHALKDHPQRGLVYIVDHGLRAGSKREAELVKRFAITCGYDARVLKWNSNFPKTALQEKARKARYNLMGEQCRKDGIEYLLTAHSQDDQAETLLMRYDRKTDWRGAAGMVEKTYGPVWPELAMVNLVRPLLDVSRENLRDYNRSKNLKWAEDPSNQNRDYARIRARDDLKTKPEIAEDLLKAADDLKTARISEQKYLAEQSKRTVKIYPAGYIILSESVAPELLFHILRAVGGTGEVIDRPKIKALKSMMQSSDFKAATLGGAQIVSASQGFIICRDPVAVRGRKDGGLKPTATETVLTPTLQIWDKRFAVSCNSARYSVRSWFGLHLPRTKTLERHIASLPACVRPTSQVITDGRQAYAPSEISEFQSISLLRPRLEAALGSKLP